MNREKLNDLWRRMRSHTDVNDIAVVVLTASELQELLLIVENNYMTDDGGMDDEDIALANADHMSPDPNEELDYGEDECVRPIPLDEQIARERGANTSYDDKE